MRAGYTASIIVPAKIVLPRVDDDGWYHIGTQTDEGKSRWPLPSRVLSIITRSHPATFLSVSSRGDTLSPAWNGEGTSPR